MVAARDLPRLTPQEYLAWEEQQPERYEYFDGEVYAMTGGTLAHGRIGLNTTSLLRIHVRGTGCIANNSDCKLAISENGPFTYPDVSVSCDDRDRVAKQYIQFPCLIIEVLSPSTEAYDRGGKFRLYRNLDSLQEYGLVSSDLKSVELFRRNESGGWEYMAYSEGETFTLTSIGLTIAVDAFYEDVILETPIEAAIVEPNRNRS